MARVHVRWTTTWTRSYDQVIDLPDDADPGRLNGNSWALVGAEEDDPEDQTFTREVDYVGPAPTTTAKEH